MITLTKPIERKGCSPADVMGRYQRRSEEVDAILNVGDGQQEADAVVHAQEEAERRTRWTLFAEECAARTYCIGPAGRMRW